MAGNGLRCRACDSGPAALLGHAQGYPFAECSRCGFIFIPAIERGAAESRYGAQGGPAAGVPGKGWSTDPGFLEPALDRLGNGRPLRILDFGCGESQLPEMLRRQGHRAVGIDLAPPARPHPDRLTGDLLDLSLDGGRFDLIYSYQVFEHLPEPRPVLSELIRLAADERFLLIHTDMDTPQRAAGFFNWFYVMPPMHCSYYRLRTFATLLEDQPARIVWSNPWSVLIQKTTA